MIIYRLNVCSIAPFQLKDVYEETSAVRKQLTGVLKSKLPPEGAELNVTLGAGKELKIMKTGVDSLNTDGVSVGETKLNVNTNTSASIGQVIVEVCYNLH